MTMNSEGPSNESSDQQFRLRRLACLGNDQWSRETNERVRLEFEQLPTRFAEINKMLKEAETVASAGYVTPAFDSVRQFGEDFYRAYYLCTTLLGLDPGYLHSMPSHIQARLKEANL